MLLDEFCLDDFSCTLVALADERDCCCASVLADFFAGDSDLVGRAAFPTLPGDVGFARFRDVVLSESDESESASKCNLS